MVIHKDELSLEYEEVELYDFEAQKRITPFEAQDVKFCYYILTKKALEEITPRLNAFMERVAYTGFDIETHKENGDTFKTGENVNWMTDIIAVVSISDGDETFVFRIAPDGNDNLITRDLFQKYIELFFRKPICGHNLLFDLRFILRDYGVMPPLIFDTMIAAKVAYHLKNMPYNLGAVAMRYLRIKLSKGLQKSKWSRIFLGEDQISYAALDTYVIPYLVKELVKAMNRHKNAKTKNTDSQYLKVFGVENQVFHLEMEIIPIFTMFCNYGVYVDVKAILDHSDRFEILETSLLTEFSRISDGTNPRSPGELMKFLRKKLKKFEFKTSTGEIVFIKDLPSTSQEHLQAFYGQNCEVIDKLYELRTTSGNIQRVKELDYLIEGGRFNRVYPSFNTLRAVSGRTSCSKPNLQNVKNKKKLDVNLKELFIAPPGKKLVVVDYSQIQLVIAAEFTKDPVMMKVINDDVKGIDLHKTTASAISGIPIHLITDAERKNAKPVNFGLIFGMGAKTLVEYAWLGYGVIFTLEQTMEIRRKFFELYAYVKAWHDRVAFQKINGMYTCETLFKRVSYATIFTEATNYGIQGSEADVMKLAMIFVTKEFQKQKLDATITNMVHDELVVECKDDQAEYVKEIVESEMIRAGKMLIKNVKVKVEGHICDSWAEGKG